MNAFLSIAARCALVLASISCASAPGDTGAVRPTNIIEFRSVSDSARTGWDQAALDGEVVYLSPDPVISDSDIEHVESTTRTSQVILDIWLTPEGARRLYATTAASRGKRMALLLNSDLLQAPTIRSPVPGPDERIQAGVSLPDSAAARLTIQLRERWPAR